MSSDEKLDEKLDENGEPVVVLTHGERTREREREILVVMGGC
jgi:MoaA/NifB/PqqE/SkfB family radical SAM enzyme